MMRLLEWLGARGKTAYLMLAYALFVFLLAVFGTRSPSAVIDNIARLPSFGVLYAAAGLHLLACLVTFWPVIRQRTSVEVPDDPGASISVPHADLAQAARGHGLRPARRSPPQATLFVRHLWAPVGTFVFHAALLLLPVAWLVSRATRFTGEAWIVEGHAFGGTRAEYARVDGVEARMPRVAFDVERIEAAFWGDRLFFTDLSALVRLPGSAETRRVRLPQPIALGGARVSITGFNYTPAVDVRGPAGEAIESADANLWLFPPGTEDSFSVAGLPYRFWVRLYPDSEGPGARPVNRGYRPRRPLIHVAVTSGKRLVQHGWRRIGEPLLFDGNSIRFPAIRKGGEIRVHRDPGQPILWTALVLALAGAAARIAFPSTRVWIVTEAGGARAIVREDLFGPGRGAAFVAELVSP